MEKEQQQPISLVKKENMVDEEIKRDFDQDNENSNDHIPRSEDIFYSPA